jgi:hypothetical protein
MITRNRSDRTPHHLAARERSCSIPRIVLTLLCR